MNCATCGHRSYSQQCWRCKPRARIATRTLPTQRGKEYVKWQETKAKWFETNKAPYYTCHYCGKLMTRSQLTLDHKVPRSRDPWQRHSKKNLVPCCAPCNFKKGSVSHDDYAHTCHNLKGGE